MYEELVKDLRENHDKYFARDMQAADAIEELEKQLHAEKEACDAYYYAYQHWMHQYIKDIGDRDTVVSKEE